MDEIVINGARYGSPEEMTPGHRKLFLRAVKELSAEGLDDLPDTLEVYGDPDGSDLRIETTSTREEVSVDGVPAKGGLAGLPPEMREAVLEAREASASSAADAGSMDRPSPDEVEAMLRRAGGSSRSSVGPSRSVKFLLYALVGLILGLVVLSLVL